ncbi:MAG TPA: outer membrane beta-barrel protein [Flavipsychrobacter sp.]|nr:outer membrane beta-barrel protein [Flavipsychrobacter sp.]
MKKTLHTLFLLTIVGTATAQTAPRNYMIGANIMTTSVNFQSGNTGYDLALQPKLGYFLNENLVIGVAAELGVSAVKSNTTMNYGITPFARIFAGKANFSDIPTRVLFFVEAGGGFGGRNSRFEAPDGTKTNVTTNGAIFYVGPGVDIFLTRNVAFEIGAEYRHIGGEPDLNRVSLNLGFQIFLSKNEGKKARQEIKADM